MIIKLIEKQEPVVKVPVSVAITLSVLMLYLFIITYNAGNVARH